MKNSKKTNNNSSLKEESVKIEFEIIKLELKVINHFINEETSEDANINKEVLNHAEIELIDSALDTINFKLNGGLNHDL